MFSKIQFTAVRLSCAALLFTLLNSVAGAGPLEDLQPGQWYAAPNSQMSSVDPCPNNNCAYSGAGGQRAVISDWNGGAFATRYGTKGGFIAWGGGHNGYLGNEIYVFDLGTLTWERVTEPVSNPSCSYGEAELQNGSPCSPHNYDYIDYHPGTNSFIKLGSASDHTQGGSGSPRVHLYSFDTNTWRRGARKPSYVTGTGATSAYDPNRDVFWYLPAYDVAFAKYDPNANGGAGQWTDYVNFGIEIDGNAAIDPVRDLYVVVEGRSSNRTFALDLKNPNLPGIPLNTTGDRTIEQTKANGFDWDPVSGQFVGWAGGTQVYTLKPPATGDWRTAQWVWSRVNPAAGNTVTPTAPQGVGTYSRWRYVPNLNLFILVNAHNQNVFFYKLSQGGGVTNPNITFSASPTSIAPQGTTNLTWSVADANACTASAAPAASGWSGSKALSGTQTIGPIAASTAFTLACTSSDGGSANRTVNVTVASSTPAPTVNFSANPTSVALNAFATLQWTTSNATSCTGSGGLAGWPGAKGTQGSESVGPFLGNASFNLSCTGAGGTTQRTVAVSLLAAPGVTFSANPTTVTSGARSTLTWSSTNATACAATGGWSGAKATSGSEQTPVLNATTNFVLECTGLGGATERTVTVTVNGTPSAPVVTLSASPATVDVNGSATLTWTSTNANSCTASDAWSGSKATSGSQSTGALSNTQTYTLTCTGAGGSAGASTTVTVSPGGGGGGGGTSTDSGGGSLGWLSIAGLAMLLFARRRRGIAV